MFERIRHMLVKEFIQIFRDPRMRYFIFVPPIIQLFIFGYAATMDVRHIATAVYDLDNSVASRELVGRFVGSGYFDIFEHVDTSERATELMNRSQVRVILRFNAGFQSSLLAGQSAPVQVIVDGTDSNTAGVVLQYSTKIAQQFSEDRFTERLARTLGVTPASPGLAIQTRTWFNENLESRSFYIPGLIAIIVMLTTLTLTSMAVVREKEIGTMEQVMVTPIRPAEFILGKTVPSAIIGIIDMVIIAVIAVLWFGIPLRGSYSLLLFATGLYLMTSLGFGLLISTACQTQQQALMITFFFFFPAVLLSGFMFPIQNMPRIVQWITYVNPLRYFMVIIRGIFLKGIGIDILWPQMLALFLIGVATLFLATKRLHKTLA
jgi:ABC-2 type transport system permease protein